MIRQTRIGVKVEETDVAVTGLRGIQYVGLEGLAQVRQASE